MLVAHVLFYFNTVVFLHLYSLFEKLKLTSVLIMKEKRQMCRICLVEDVRMYVVTNKDMQDLYAKLTDIPVST